MVGQQTFLPSNITRDHPSHPPLYRHPHNPPSPHHPAATPYGANANPYALFRFCCTNLFTKDHAQLCGVISFSLFLCLVVISLMLFGALSIFYIVTGLIVYSLLMKCLFGSAEKVYVLFYLLFEAVQIGFCLALVFYVALPLLFYAIPRQHCKLFLVRLNNTTMERRQICSQPVMAQEYMELLLFILVLVTIKMYFARIFACYYKYLVWNEKLAAYCAQYINGSGIRIPAMGHLFPSPPPSFWDNPVVRDTQYGYDQHHQSATTSHHNIAALGVPHFPELPSYAQAISQQKMTTAQQANQEQTGEENGDGNGTRTTDGDRPNMHV